MNHFSEDLIKIKNTLLLYLQSYNMREEPMIKLIEVLLNLSLEQIDPKRIMVIVETGIDMCITETI